MDIELSGKTAVVTGAAMGIGREICAGFASNDVRVIGVDIVDMDETGKYIDSMGKGELWNQVTIDLASPESVNAGCKEIMGDFPSVDVLVNNAAVYGGLKMTPMEKLGLDEWEKVMAVNVRGTFLMIRELLPALIKAKGHVINFASGAALRGSPGLMHYVASKGAVIGMTRALATELGAHGITVNAVAPGFVSNEASQQVGGEMFSKYMEMTVGAQAIHEPVQAKDIVGTVLYLASPLADAVTGQLCPVDRGLVKY
jgi:NAD(P)-dependent dehydrogenase (short-subunit alcohol dehydrogenase family)